MLKRTSLWNGNGRHTNVDQRRTFNISNKLDNKCLKHYVNHLLNKLNASVFIVCCHVCYLHLLSMERPKFTNGQQPIGKHPKASPKGRTIKVTTHHSRLIDEACNNQQPTIELICDNLFAVNMFAVVTAYKSFSLHDT